MQGRENSGVSGAKWSRRGFLASVGWAGTALLLPRAGLAETAADSAEDCLLCVGSFGEGDTGTLHVVARHGRRWERSGTAATERPMAVAAHPVLPVVYVANGVKAYRYEPRGTVEAFHVDHGSARVESLGRQALSLSATEPRSLAVAPDGRSLLVAASGGGAYNILPLDDAGVPGAPETILKQIGRGTPEGHDAPAGGNAPAHPAAVVFHPRDGWAMGVDAGANRLDFLAPLATGFAVIDRVHGEAESGLSGVALDGEGRVAVVMQRTRPALLSCQIAGGRGPVVLGRALLDSVPMAITFHGERKIVYCATQSLSGRGRLEAWRVRSTTGEFQRLNGLAMPAGDVRAMHCIGNMLALASGQGLIAVGVDADTAEPRGAEMAVAIPGASSVAALSGR